MKTLIRIILGLVLLLVVIAAAGVSYLYLRYPVAQPPSAVKIEATPERLARGEYLTLHVNGCLACHSDRDWSRFGGPIQAGTLGRGGQRFDQEHDAVPGVIYGKNITPAAIGAWTDGEVLRAVTSGVSRDGTPLFPLMPYPHFGSMAEDDVHAVIAYIRSLKAIENAVPARTLIFPMNLITRTIPSPATFKARPAPGDKAYGEYMVNAALCSDCHTPIDDRGQPLPGRDFSGGLVFRNPKTGYRVVTANLTPDADTGIGSWTEQQFVDKFKGLATQSDAVLSDAEQRQSTVMPWSMFAGMTREDLAAIYGYLRALKPVTNRVGKFPDAQPSAGQ